MGVYPSLFWARQTFWAHVLAQQLLQTLAGGGRRLHVTVAEAAVIQHVALSKAVEARILGGSRAGPHACPLQCGLQKFSDSLVFLGGRLPNNFKLTLHCSEKPSKQDTFKFHHYNILGEPYEPKTAGPRMEGRLHQRTEPAGLGLGSQALSVAQDTKVLWKQKERTRHRLNVNVSPFLSECCSLLYFDINAQILFFYRTILHQHKM